MPMLLAEVSLGLLTFVGTKFLPPLHNSEVPHPIGLQKLIFLKEFRFSS